MSDGDARQRAVTELTDLIKRQYPTAPFEIGPGEDHPSVTHITTTVDLDDPDAVADLVVADLVMERKLELQQDEGIPVYVIPIRTPERVAALRRQQADERRHEAPLLAPQPAWNEGVLNRAACGPLARASSLDRRWFHCPAKRYPTRNLLSTDNPYSYPYNRALVANRPPLP